MTSDETSSRDRFGRYVTPYDIPGGPPRGFRFDGSTGVPDLELETAACHDWDYLVGRRKSAADARYAWRLICDWRPLVAVWRFTGLTFLGWPAYMHHRANRKLRGVEALIAERMVPHAQDDRAWVWPVRTWRLRDLRRRT